MIKTTLAISTLAACGTFSSALAQDTSPVTIAGFGTAALTKTNNDLGEFARTGQAAGAGKDARTGVDSDFGVQATAKWNDQISFTAQGLARKHGDTDQYTAELAWAFAKFKANDDFSVRLGRIGLPIYMISDSRNIGFANTMLRPPTEVYQQVPLDNANGGDVIYQHSFGDTTATAQFALGVAKDHSRGGTTVNSSSQVASLTLENGPFTYRLGHARANVSVHSPALEQLVAGVKAARLGIADQLNVIDFTGKFTSLGLIMDYKNVLAQAEYAKRKTDTRLIPDTTSWYLMLGYRWGAFVPYYVHGNAKQDSIRSFSGLPTTGPLAALSAGVNGAIKAGLQTTDAVGLRWDFYKSAAFKVQIDRVRPRDGAGYFINTQPGFSGPVTVYAAAVDFVF
ncbi:hypothetical protein [Duganella radicis]|uniref:Porin n=1 Tax=Duganella radicis TaxID=551988 RepID=A0A6L6PBL1_9BURK|nr:hypothetical protein [Duganella radicis]MTV36476.1 hypothetical protein [Duganella radicis]